MIDDEDFVQHSLSCFDVCVALELAIQGKNVDDLNKSAKSSLEELERCVDWPSSCPFTTSSNFRTLCELERTLTSGANAPHTEYSKEKVEERKRQIQGILDRILVIGAVVPLGPTASDGTDPTSVVESGKSSFLSLSILCGVVIVPSVRSSPSTLQLVNA